MILRSTKYTEITAKIKKPQVSGGENGQQETAPKIIQGKLTKLAVIMKDLELPNSSSLIVLVFFHRFKLKRF